MFSLLFRWSASENLEKILWCQTSRYDLRQPWFACKRSTLQGCSSRSSSYNRSKTTCKQLFWNLFINFFIKCLKDTVERVLPFWNETICKGIKEGKKIIVSAHGNSLRAIVKHLKKMTDAGKSTFLMVWFLCVI